MALSDFINQKTKQQNNFGGGGGLGGFISNNTPSTPNQNYPQQIENAQTRLTSVGQDLPEAPSGNSILDGVLGVLNYLNNKKNQGISYLSGDKDAFKHDVTGADLLEQWGVQNDVAKNVGGFGFDVLTDPLNFLTFGAGGAANAAAKGGIKAGQMALGGATKKAPTVAKLGAFGKGFEIPGSGQVIGAVGEGVSKATRGLGRFIEEKAPELAQIGRSTRDLGGRLFIRGYGIPGAVNQATKRSEDLFRMDTVDIINDISTMTKDWKDLDSLKIIKAVESPQHFTALNEREVEAFNQVKDFFDMNFLKAQSEEVIDEFRANYIPHIFKGKKEDIADALKQIGRRGARMATTSGFNQERNIMMDISHIMSDPELFAKLKPETDLGKIMGIYKVSLQKAIRNKDLVEELTALGPEVIRRFSDGDIPDSWVKAPVQQLSSYAVPPDIARHLKDVMEPFVNSDSATKLFKLYDDVLGWWKGMATIPNPGFHFRNGLGSIFNNYLGGVRGLEPYKLASQALKMDDHQLDDFFNLIRSREGMDFSPVTLGANLDAPGFNVNSNMTISRLFDEPRFRETMTGGDGPKINVSWEGKTYNLNLTGVKFLSKLYGVTGRGFISGDISDTLEHTLRKLRSERTVQEINPLSRENPLFQGAEKLGSWVEDETRMAHFIDRLQKGDTALDASMSVKKYLYDYTQLTPFEKNVMKRFIPFYSFTRFNLPLQLRELVKQPKYATLMGKFQDFADGMASDLTGEDVEKDSLPRYLRDLYSVRLPFQAGGKDITLGVDVPIRDVNTFSPENWFSMITPFLTVPMEQAANKNVYFDRELERYEGETVKAPGYLQGIFRGISALEPDAPESESFNKLANTFGFVIGVDEENGQPELRIPVRSAHLLNQIVGLKNIGKVVDTVSGRANDPFGVSSTLTGVTAVSSSAEDREKFGQIDELKRLEDLLQKLRDEGRPAPTIRELQQEKGQNTTGGGLSSFIRGR